MSVLDEVLKTMDDHTHVLAGSGFSKPRLNTLFTLYAANNQHVFSIGADGKVTVDPQYTTGQAVDQFWNWLTNHTNLVQLAVDQAKADEREAIAKLVEDQGKQWGIMRSMRATNYASAAKDLANLIRK